LSKFVFFFFTEKMWITVPRTRSSISRDVKCFFACLFVRFFLNFCKEIFVFCITSMIFWSLTFSNQGAKGGFWSPGAEPRNLCRGARSPRYIMPWHDNSGHKCYVLVPLPKNNYQLQPIVTNAINLPTLYSLLKLLSKLPLALWKRFLSRHHSSFFSSSTFFGYCIYFLLGPQMRMGMHVSPPGLTSEQVVFAWSLGEPSSRSTKVPPFVTVHTF